MFYLRFVCRWKPLLVVLLIVVAVLNVHINVFFVRIYRNAAHTECMIIVHRSYTTGERLNVSFHVCWHQTAGHSGGLPSCIICVLSQMKNGRIMIKQLSKISEQCYSRLNECRWYWKMFEYNNWIIDSIANEVFHIFNVFCLSQRTIRLNVRIEIEFLSTRPWGKFITPATCTQFGDTKQPAELSWICAGLRF